MCDVEPQLVLLTSLVVSTFSCFICRRRGDSVRFGRKCRSRREHRRLGCFQGNAVVAAELIEALPSGG